MVCQQIKNLKNSKFLNIFCTMGENDQSYQEVYTQNIQQRDEENEESAYENQLMLDEHDQIELYTNQHINQQKNKSKIQKMKQLPSDNLHHQDQKDSEIIDQLSDSGSIKNTENQQQTGFQQDTQAVVDLLQTKYAHFNQKILIKMLHDSLFPHSTNIIPQSPEHTKIRQTKIQNSGSFFEKNQRKDYQTIKKLNKIVKIYLQHGYGINIARKYASKGQNIQPNPYNNTIGKIIKDTWKTVELQVIKIKKQLKPLRTDKFNQIKTPLIHAKNWMQKRYLYIFHQIISNIHGLKNQQPSSKDYQEFYDYVMEKSKNKKNINDKRFYMPQTKIQSKEIDESSSENFVPRKKEKISEEKYNRLTKLVKNSMKNSGK